MHTKFWAWFLLIFTLLTILAGGIVRTTHSGMGCPDWPKCFGQWVPPTTAQQLPPDFEKYLRKQDIDHTFNAFHTWVEYINRLLATLLGVLAIVQLYIMWRNKSRNKNSSQTVLNFARAFLAVVIITGLLGALVVRFNLQHYSISVHMTLAFLLVAIQVALCTHVCNACKKLNVNRQYKNLILAFLILAFIQTALGTGVRMFIDDISLALQYTQREKWLAILPTIFIIHRTTSWLVVAGLLALNYFSYKQHVFKKATLFLSGLILTEVLLGIIMAYANIPAWAQPIHVTLSACIIAQILFMVFSSYVKK